MISLASPMFSGNSPEKLFIERARTDKLRDWKSRIGREPLNLLSGRMVLPTSISASQSVKFPSRLFSLISRKSGVFWVEIHSGISPARPHDSRDSRDSIHFGTIFTLLLQASLFLPRNKYLSALILNNQDRISPLSMLFSSRRASNLLIFCIDGGIPPVKKVLLKFKVVMFDKFPILLGISTENELLFRSSTCSSFRCITGAGIPP
ncbi:LRR receptor-like serine/threonine-protein kinase [Actinidia chinensis var. chinensis]|uniref:LRR receptor-like serine/threonine-protein kinase n=1 Tax=Actinidia chinensis var. chinensis TaxID=1590841 RepID=A0A2R6P8I4_ACTCC|nr:LRR receptor-like serine/threonine-protein kinase [Actinidia chinensis var. chinensis]